MPEWLLIALYFVLLGLVFTGLWSLVDLAIRARMK